MDANSLKAKKQRLKLEINKSLTRVRLSKNGKLTLADKQRIKNAAANGLQRFVKAELKRTTTKTYDWYFTKTENDRIQVGTPLRNNLGYNRYFIIDYVEVPINTQYSYTSYCTYERVREFSISSKEISDIISGSKRLFNRMLTVTVSEKEDAKIYAAFDNVDEKKIISVTIGVPVAVIGTANTLPFIIAEGQLIAGSGSYLKSTIIGSGAGLSLESSVSSSLTSIAADATSQYVGNGFDFKEVDPLKATMSGVFKVNASSVLLKSSVSSRSDYGYVPQLNSFGETAINFSFGMLGRNSINQNISSLGLSEFNKSMGGYLENILKMGANSTKTAIVVEVKKEMEK
ncbi:hypothetical protein [Zobellia galactanivorans]|uniref:Uncharacterized protein n=1 Tax=Zobellia galactanivorans (strain DSM 12802 / CCUG 47099 / CIP 106680 / NCIMB 13871 / Dsij) TaxID=63186 RepID=G0L9A9_ZOBGA|nr:hypothetical protein [Zobellia galactanivorans]CAZ94467.1 Hypothetical protein ZOBELLIA_394 [Zobellia galactanivorans]